MSNKDPNCDCSNIVDWGDGTKRCRICTQLYNEAVPCEFVDFGMFQIIYDEASDVDWNAIAHPNFIADVENKLGTKRLDNIPFNPDPRYSVKSK